MYFSRSDIQYYNFYSIPKDFILNSKFKNISLGAKLFYGLLLDRFNLSIKNDWRDKEGYYYFYFTNKEAMILLNVSKNTITKLFKELENNNLLDIKRQGLSKPNKIYLKKINFED